MSAIREAIRERREAAESAIGEAEGQLEIARAGLRAVQRACRHPNAEEYDTSCMGEPTHVWQCLDCGARRST